MAADLLIGEIIYFLAGILLIGVLTAVFWRDSTVMWMLGFTEGFLLSVGLLLHMTYSLEDSVSMLEDEALKHTRITYIIRMIVLAAAVLLIIFLRLGNIAAVLFGLMSLKVAAYLQPITHKITKKFISEGR